MCGRACHCIHLAHLHEWDFSIPPLPKFLRNFYPQAIFAERSLGEPMCLCKYTFRNKTGNQKKKKLYGIKQYFESSRASGVVDLCSPKTFSFLPTSAGNAQAQLHFRDDQQRAFGISNISNCFIYGDFTHLYKVKNELRVKTGRNSTLHFIVIFTKRGLRFLFLLNLQEDST